MDVLLVVAEADDPVSLETVEAQAPRIVEGLLRGLDKTKGSNEVSVRILYYDFRSRSLFLKLTFVRYSVSSDLVLPP